MESMDCYNGFSPDEREGMNSPKYSKLAKAATCSMGEDPRPVGTQTHAVDHTLPSTGLTPALYPVRILCQSRIHTRFSRKANWAAYLQFLSRCRYAQEVDCTDLQELKKNGGVYQWKQLPQAPLERTTAHASWWKSLTLDEASNTGPKVCLGGTT